MRQKQTARIKSSDPSSRTSQVLWVPNSNYYMTISLNVTKSFCRKISNVAMMSYSVKQIDSDTIVNSKQNKNKYVQSKLLKTKSAQRKILKPNYMIKTVKSPSLIVDRCVQVE